MDKIAYRWLEGGVRVTGVDFSEPAIQKARALADGLNLKAEFVCRDIASLKEAMPGKGTFDWVMCTYGTLGCLPDLQGWAETVDAALQSGGSLVLVDFHPVIWMFDNEIREITHLYFNFGPLCEELLLAVHASLFILVIALLFNNFVVVKSLFRFGSD